MVLHSLLWLASLAPECFFVDQAERGIALVRFDRGTTALVQTDAAEGALVCGAVVHPPPSHRDHHRSAIAARTTLEELAHEDP